MLPGTPDIRTRLEARGLWPSFRRRRGQAMTEVVLLFPIFMIIAFLTIKIFQLLVLVQKMEIASYYAGRRWQLESHINIAYAADDRHLKQEIEKVVRDYLGFGTDAQSVKLDIERTQVWNVVTITVQTKPPGLALFCKYPKQTICATPYGQACNDGYDYICGGGKKLEVVKYVPNRDRPIQFVLPGLQ
ncbi:MAG: TadE family protein [Elusimicrobia bacterium]|nr:MAG: TadE family protein [Elusimicrobiota bacterium]KAF0157816.1 MAG: TadE family protein [Elusimicrobiota bacterium]